MAIIKRLSQEIIFDSSQLSKDLAGKSVRSGMATMSSQAVSFILQIVSTVILARLLSPADFGLIGMVSVVVNFAAMFKDAGLSMATVQKDNINHGQISTLFWINVTISLFLGLSIFVCSPLVAWFYGKLELTAVAAVLSFSFVLSGLGLQHTALLRRHMYFGSLAIVQITTQVISLAVTILLAIYGYRYWALVGGSITTAFFNTILSFYFCPWIPGRIRKRAGVRDMLQFGGHLTGFDLINYFTRNADNILIGKFIGVDALGLYAKAYQIIYMPLTKIRNPINSVAIPVLSSLKDDPECLRRYYGKIVFVLALFSMPLMAFCAMFSKEVILLIFGKQWLGMTQVFRLLAIAGFIQPVTGTRGALLIAYGQSKVYLTLGIITAVVSVVGFCVGIFWGITGMAASFVVVVYAIQFPMFSIAFKYTPCSFRELFGNCWHIALFSCFSVFFAKGLMQFLPEQEFIPILWGSVIMLFSLSALIFVTPVTRGLMQEGISILRKGLSS